MSETYQEYQSNREKFSTFKMADGTIHRIRNKYLLDFATEAFHGREPLSKGATLIRDCVAHSGNAGGLTELLEMLKR